MTRHARRQHATRRRAGLLGLAAMLVIAGIAYIAFDALNGLPWQSRYHVTIAIPDANRLIAADDVRSGGVRVGQVEDVTAVSPTAARPAHALVRLALDSDVGPVPVDSAVSVRSASPLGATYVELDLGRARRTVPDGGTWQPPGTSPVSNLVDLFDIFDRNTRRSFTSGVRDLSDGFAGRGAALGATLANLARLLPALTDVADLLAAPPARVARFIDAAASFGDALAPVSGRLADLVTHGADTFAAIAGARRELGAAIDIAPSAEQTAAGALTAARPGLTHLAALSTRLRRATRRLPLALGVIDRALRAGTPALAAVPPVVAPLRTSLRAITSVAAEPSTDGAVRKLTQTFDATNQILDALLPAQTQCNLIPLLFQQFASYIGMMGVGDGPSMLNIAVDRPGASGDEIQSAKPAPNLHINYVPHEGRDECEAGNEPFDGSKQVLDSPAGLQPARTRESTPPPHVLDLARTAGLLDQPGGRR